jgi:D-proline reductase (dithiol) PrdB
MGHVLGEAGNLRQQRVVLGRALRALVQIEEAGTIIDLPYRWRRYEDLDLV